MLIKCVLAGGKTFRKRQNPAVNFIQTLSCQYFGTKNFFGTLDVVMMGEENERFIMHNLSP